MVRDGPSEGSRRAAELAAVRRLFDARALTSSARPLRVLHKVCGGPTGMETSEEPYEKGSEYLAGRADRLEPLLGARPEVEIWRRARGARTLRNRGIPSRILHAAKGSVLIHRQPPPEDGT